MKYPNQFYILLLQLISKHSTINNDYMLTRYFAKSTYWGSEPLEAIRELIEEGFLSITEIKYGNNYYYEITGKGIDYLKSKELPTCLDEFALSIDETGYIRNMTYLLEGLKLDSKT